MDKVFDLIIIGAGPAGLSASIYASRYKLNHLVIGKEIGGQISEAWEIENYPGFEKISGKELMQKFSQQAKKLGAEIIQETAAQVKKQGENFEISLSDGKTYLAKTIIFALGMKARKANISGEDNFIGKGVSYCATCDGMFFRNKKVVVVGGGDSAATAALQLAEFATEVKILYRGEEVRFEPAWMEKIENNQKIELVLNTVVKEIKGEGKVSSVICDQRGEEKEIFTEGVFVEIGTVPGVGIVKDLRVEVDENDYIIVDQEQKTNLENIWAAGDATTNSNKFRQVITAAAEGAVAVGSVYKKIKLNK